MTPCSKQICSLMQLARSSFQAPAAQTSQAAVPPLQRKKLPQVPATMLSHGSLHQVPQGHAQQADVKQPRFVCAGICVIKCPEKTANLHVALSLPQKSDETGSNNNLGILIEQAFRAPNGYAQAPWLFYPQWISSSERLQRPGDCGTAKQ
eukprot:CAMPEP_0172936938 /NCGR_PEP_ID=MMETSP1075-20121228/222272_1 /TAXON_ID=2916 /ORGANISM="Ceratium fusus, Strain PA161109" /LENGTH=149 /DNA_ID=CAMNT_0013798311 /DNA_START=1246 /DNA_END=1697 /DNA_ORIENTATION=+